MRHGGEIYDKKIEHDFSVSINPLGCPSEVMKALKDAMADVDKYPDMEQRAFRRAVAEVCLGDKITENNILGGNGASELIMAIVRMISPRTALIPAPGFSGYRYALESGRDSCRISEYRFLPEEDFSFNRRILEQIVPGLDLMIITNPNNPTGRTLDKELMTEVINKCRETGTKIIFDECFLDLCSNGCGAIQHIYEYDGVFIISAYTKLFSIPGVRVGFCISQKKNIEELKRFLPEWNMSVFAQKAGEACAKTLCDTDFRTESVKFIKKEREYITSELTRLGYIAYPSDGNYILFRDQRETSGEHANLYSRLISRGILIRDCSGFAGLTEGYYRVAVRSHEENELLIKTLSL